MGVFTWAFPCRTRGPEGICQAQWMPQNNNALPSKLHTHDKVKCAPDLSGARTNQGRSAVNTLWSLAANIIYEYRREHDWRTSRCMIHLINFEVYPTVRSWPRPIQRGTLHACNHWGSRLMFELWAAIWCCNSRIGNATATMSGRKLEVSVLSKCQILTKESSSTTLTPVPIQTTTKYGPMVSSTWKCTGRTYIVRECHTCKSTSKERFILTDRLVAGNDMDLSCADLRPG